MSSRVFHYSEGASHKFWSVTVAETVCTVCFGRIGAAGQTQAKTFASAEEAAQAAARLVAQKIKKGYVEVAPEEAARATPKKMPPRRRSKPGRQLLLPF